jgi:hypothetical protein
VPADDLGCCVCSAAGSLAGADSGAGDVVCVLFIGAAGVGRGMLALWAQLELWGMLKLSQSIKQSMALVGA